MNRRQSLALVVGIYCIAAAVLIAAGLAWLSLPTARERETLEMIRSATDDAVERARRQARREMGANPFDIP